MIYQDRLGTSTRKSENEKTPQSVSLLSKKPTVDSAPQRRAEVDSLLPQELERPNPIEHHGDMHSTLPAMQPRLK